MASVAARWRARRQRRCRGCEQNESSPAGAKVLYLLSEPVGTRRATPDGYWAHNLSRPGCHAIPEDGGSVPLSLPLGTLFP